MMPVFFKDSKYGAAYGEQSHKFGFQKQIVGTFAAMAIFMVVPGWPRTKRRQRNIAFSSEPSRILSVGKYLETYASSPISALPLTYYQ